jgi:DNA-binding transcriptional LysR family regulator
MTLPPRVSDLIPFDLLLTVARVGSLGQAAAEHGMSQPAASARMRQLEGQLHLALIERSPRGSRLTPVGALVADWAQAVVDAAAALNAGVTALAELSSTTAIKSAVAAGAGPAVLSSLAVAGELTAGTLRAVPVIGLNLNRVLRAVWRAGHRLTGPAQDLYTIAARSARPA